MIQQYKYKQNYPFSAGFTSSLFSCLHLPINSDFLFSRCLWLKCFTSQNFSVKQSLQMPPLGVVWTIDIIFHFYSLCYIFIFQFPHLFRKFSAVNVLLVKKISFETFKHLTFKHHNISYLMCWVLIPLLHIQCLPLNIYYWVAIWLPFLQLHLSLLDIGWITIRLWKAMTEPIFLHQL